MSGAGQVFVFPSTHHALWAEQVALEGGFAAQVVPAPPESGALCHLALETLSEDLERLAGVLAAVGVEFGLHPPA
jgi:hypothetical protein